MANVMDYLDWRGDLSLAVSPFNEVDNYVCCMVATPDYTGVITGEQPLSAVMAAYDAKHGEAGNRLGTLLLPTRCPWCGGNFPSARAPCGRQGCRRPGRA